MLTPCWLLRAAAFAASAASASAQVVILFSAHSVPMQVVEKGDHYVPEVCGSVKAIMEKVTQEMTNSSVDGASIPRHILAWQSKVGFLVGLAPLCAVMRRSPAATAACTALLSSATLYAWVSSARPGSGHWCTQQGRGRFCCPRPAPLCH